MCIRDSIRTGAYGDSHIGPCQGRSVIDTVTDHGNPVPLRLEFGNFPFLVLR